MLHDLGNGGSILLCGKDEQEVPDKQPEQTDDCSYPSPDYNGPRICNSKQTQSEQKASPTSQLWDPQTTQPVCLLAQASCPYEDTPCCAGLNCTDYALGGTLCCVPDGDPCPDSNFYDCCSAGCVRSGPDKTGPSICGRSGAEGAQAQHEEKDGCAFQDPHYDGPRKCKGKDYNPNSGLSQIHTHPFDPNPQTSNISPSGILQTSIPEAAKCLNAQAPCVFTSDCCSGLNCQSNPNNDGSYCCYSSGQQCYSDNDCCSVYCVQNAQGAGTCE